MQTIANYIDGRLTPPAGGGYFDDVEPATRGQLARVPDSDGADVDRAVDAACRAFPAWAATPAAERSRLLLRVADLIDENLERLAEAESRDTGKPISLARALDIPRAAANFRFFATAILHEQSESHDTDGRALNFTLRRPRGVAGLISPWNLPLYLFTWKIAPALATGNTAVAKPSEVTPLSAFLLSELCIEAGLPAGVLNIVHGTGPKVGAAIVAHPRVPAISFTGGTKTGEAIARAAAPMFKKLSLELGGKNPAIVFKDADFERAVSQAVRYSFLNQGQICLCCPRIFVERPMYARFVEELVERTKALRVGDPLDAATEQGSLVSQAHREKVASYVALAREEGGEILCGGVAPEALPERCREGAFFLPTVVTGLASACRVQQEEIFGPVTVVTPFDTEAEALEMANSTPYGLAATVWTSDLGRAQRVSSGLLSGIVWVNCWLLRDLRTPFGGMKQSGVGREGGVEALRFFTEPKNVCVAVSE